MERNCWELGGGPEANHVSTMGKAFWGLPVPWGGSLRRDPLLLFPLPPDGSFLIPFLSFLLFGFFPTLEGNCEANACHQRWALCPSAAIVGQELFPAVTS